MTINDFLSDNYQRNEVRAVLYRNGYHNIEGGTYSIIGNDDYFRKLLYRLMVNDDTIVFRVEIASYKLLQSATCYNLFLSLLPAQDRSLQLGH